MPDFEIEPMSRLRSFSRSLREVFEESVTVRYIGSPLASFDAERTAAKIRKWLVEKDYDQVGVRRDGVVVGYALAQDLGSGSLGDYLRSFQEDDLVVAEMPMLVALQRIRDRRRIFIRTLGAVNGIATPGDVIKPPVRLWLFGLLTVFEMQITRLIRGYYPRDSWTPVVTPSVVKRAQQQLMQRRLNETDVGLVDCLDLSAKQRVILRTPALLGMLQIGTALEATEGFQRVRSLRNALAHAHNISSRWPGVLDDAQAVEEIIYAAEHVRSQDLPVEGAGELP